MAEIPFRKFRNGAGAGAECPRSEAERRVQKEGVEGKERDGELDGGGGGNRCARERGPDQLIYLTSGRTKDLISANPCTSFQHPHTYPSIDNLTRIKAGR